MPANGIRKTKKRARLGSLSDQLRTVREGCRVTTTKVAEIAGVSSGYISQVELGDVKPTPAILMGYTKALGLSMEELITGKGDPNKPAKTPTLTSCPTEANIPLALVEAGRRLNLTLDQTLRLKEAAMLAGYNGQWLTEDWMAYFAALKNFKGCENTGRRGRWAKKDPEPTVANGEA